MFLCYVFLQQVQENSNTSSKEEYIPQILTVLQWIYFVYI